MRLGRGELPDEMLVEYQTLKGVCFFEAFSFSNEMEKCKIIPDAERRLLL